MSPRLFAALVGAAIPVAGGVWTTLVGYGFLGKPAAAGAQRGRRMRPRAYRFIGPLLILLGTGIAAQPFVAPELGLDWQTFAPAGGRFSIDMPLSNLSKPNE